mmetsp:Transcript_103290/g.291656  ORF Transcript_103290/g.291656 Transcript_103290/m.291656 type:complete len:371 (-) Transcript_103290:68-1180(-)
MTSTTEKRRKQSSNRKRPLISTWFMSGPKASCNAGGSASRHPAASSQNSRRDLSRAAASSALRSISPSDSSWPTTAREPVRRFGAFAPRTNRSLIISSFLRRSSIALCEVSSFTSTSRSPMQMTSSSSPKPRHLKFHFSSRESSPIPHSTWAPSSDAGSLHRKPHEVFLLACRLSSISTLGNSGPGTLFPSNSANSSLLVNSRTMTLSTSLRALSRNSSASFVPLLATHAPFKTRGVGSEALGSATASGSWPAHGLDDELVPDSMSGVKPSAPTRCPCSAGRSSETSKKWSKRTDTCLQPQHSVAPNRLPRKLSETHRLQLALSVADVVASETAAFVWAPSEQTSSAMLPNNVRRNSCASCCCFPRYQGN